jgi:multiple antibiotic resistance protein
MEFFLVTFIAVFVIIDPFGCAPIFLTLVEGVPQSKIKVIALRACVASILILIMLALTGTFIFQLFGITIPAFRIAGGVVLAMVAISMLNVQTKRIKTSEEEEAEATHLEDVSIVPLAMPLLAGPGSITTVIVLMSKADTLLKGLHVISSIVIVLALTYIILIYSRFLLRFLGSIGIRVISRIMGLFLLALACQFIIDGVLEVMKKIN